MVWVPDRIRDEPATAVADFVCPRDHGSLQRETASVVCSVCGSSYPVVRGVPVFICDERSVFAAGDYSEENSTAVAARTGIAAGWLGRARTIERDFARRLENVSSNVRRPFYGDAVAETLKRRGMARVLVVGSGGRSHAHPDARVICTDVAFGPHVQAIADAHDLPFADGNFDLVVAVAVLEHVADPQRCVGEIWRVLASGGLVFAITPFMQPVHMGAHDFTRFSPLGHRRLFRWFAPIDEGVAMGAGSMFGFALSGFLVSMGSNRVWRNFANLAGLLLNAPLRKLDRWMAPLPSLDNAGGCYFLGVRSEAPISDRELIALYKGAFDKSPLARVRM